MQVFRDCFSGIKIDLIRSGLITLKSNSKGQKMKLLKFCLFLILLILYSCSTSFGSLEDQVSITTISNHIIIDNQINDGVYFFVVEQKILAVINWAPSKSGPVIKSGKSVKIPFNEIFNGKSEQVKPGDKVVVYWLTNSLQDFNDVHSEVILI